MKKEEKRPKRSYSPEFKAQAIELAKDIGIKQATEKLGIKSLQTLTAWVRYSKNIEENSEFKDLELAKREIKKLKKELESEKKVVAILKDATAFFCQDHLK
jgi:transposase